MLKIVTYNVHGWQTSSFKENFKLVIESMQQIQPDVLGLNEVDSSHGKTARDTITELSLELGFDHRVCGLVDWINFGNALLSRFPFRNLKSTSLIVRDAEERNAVGADFGHYAIIVTHLDHISEDVRLKQLDTVLRFCQEFRKPHILMGDFNALTREDYTDDEWQELVEERRCRRWELPEHKVTSVMKESGYRDAWLESGNCEKRRTAHVSNPKYGIDYFWLSSDWPTGSVQCCQIIQDMASDHFPVLLEVNCPV
jgi:endonuclease/exonuclease/phosphatase family metal-dependent hydrolase